MTVIEVDAAWVMTAEGEVVYEPCLTCNDVSVCDVHEDCCPPGWVFLAPGYNRATVLCELE